MRTRLILVLVALIALNSVQAQEQLGFIEDQYIQQDETRIVDLLGFYAGQNLTFNLDSQAPANVSLVSAYQQTNFTDYAQRLNFAQIREQDETPMGFFGITKDCVLYKNIFDGQQTTDWVKILQVFSGPNIQCLSIVQQSDVNDIIYIDAIDTSNGVKNVLGKFNMGGVGVQTTNTTPYDSSIPTTRRIKSVKGYVIRAPTDGFNSTYLEVFQTVKGQAPNYVTVLNATNFSRVDLNIAGVQTFRDEVLLLDQIHGVFRFTIDQILNPSKYEHPYHRLIVDGIYPYHISVDPQAGRVFIADFACIREYLWTEERNPIIIDMYNANFDEPGSITHVLDLQWGLLVTTNNYHLNLTTMSIVTRRYRKRHTFRETVEPYVFYSQPYPNGGSFGSVYPIGMETRGILTFTPTSVYFGQYNLKGVLYQSNEVGEYDFKLNVSQDGHVVFSDNLFLSVLANPNVKEIVGSDSQLPTVVTTVNVNASQTFGLDLADYYIGPNANFQSGDSSFNVTAGISSPLTLTVNGTNVSESAGIVYSYLTTDNNETLFYIIQDSTNTLNVSQCTDALNDTTFACSGGYSIQISGTVQAAIVGDVAVAVITEQAPNFVTGYCKLTGKQLFSNQLNCTDIIYMGTHRRDHNDSLFCAQPNNQILEFNTTDWTVIATITTQGIPKYLYKFDHVPGFLQVHGTTILEMYFYADKQWYEFLTFQDPVMNKTPNEWQPAWGQRHLVIVSPDANRIMEFDFEEGLKYTKSYPLYGAKIGLSNGKASYSYSFDNELLHVAVVDRLPASYLFTYRIGEKTPSLLYNKLNLGISLPSVSFLHSTTNPRRESNVLVVNKNVAGGVRLRSRPFIDVQPQVFTTDPYFKKNLRLQITNDWGNEFDLVFTVNAWNSSETLTNAATQQSVNLNQTINVNASQGYPQFFQIPQSLVFNGSILHTDITCQVPADCQNQNLGIWSNIEKREDFKLPNGSIAQDIIATNESVYVLTHRHVYELDRHNISYIRNIINIEAPRRDEREFTCHRIRANHHQTYLVVSCSVGETAGSVLTVILIGEYPVTVAVHTTGFINMAKEIRVENDTIFVMGSYTPYLDRVAAYKLNFSAPALGRIVFSYAQDFGVLSSLQLFHGVQPDSFIYFTLEAQKNQIHSTKVQFNGTQASYVDNPIYLDNVVLKFTLDEEHPFHSIGFSATNDPNIFNATLTTVNHHNFEGQVNVQKQSYTVTQVLQRLGEADARGRLHHNDEFTVLFVEHGRRFEDQERRGGYIVYDRRSNGASGQVAYKNVFAAEHVKEDELDFQHFFFSTVIDRFDNRPHTHLFSVRVDRDGKSKVRRYHFSENVTVVVNASVTSQNIQFNAENQINRISVIVNVNQVKDQEGFAPVNNNGDKKKKAISYLTYVPLVLLGILTLVLTLSWSVKAVRRHSLADEESLEQPQADHRLLVNA